MVRTSGDSEVTPICDEHAALLKAVAKNTSDIQTQEVYADWLQERGNAGWIIVVNWPCWEWMKYVDYDDTPESLKGYRAALWKIPWLDGVVKYSPKNWTNNVRLKAKGVLTEYAEGKAVV